MRPRVAGEFYGAIAFRSREIFPLWKKILADLAAAKLARRHFDFSVVRGGRRPLFLSRRKTRKFTARLPNRPA
jgi:hypothetical protein